MKKELPNNVSAERRILAAMMRDNSLSDEIIKILQPVNFHDKRNMIIYDTMLKLNAGNIQINSITLYEEMKRQDTISAGGGVAYLTQLEGSEIELENPNLLAKIVYEKFMLREIINTSRNLYEFAFLEKKDSFEMLDSAITQLEQLRNVLEFAEDELNAREYIGEFFREIEDMRAHGIERGYKSGVFPTFDVATGGILPGDLIAISGKDKAGKTTFALELLTTITLKYDLNATAISLEMPKKQYATKVYSQNAPIRYGYLRNPTDRLRDGTFAVSNAQLSTAYASLSKNLAQVNLYIIDQILTDEQLYSKIKFLVRKKNVQILMIDYISLIKPARRAERRDIEISEISRNMKLMARELNIPIIMLSQENTDGSTADSQALKKDCDYWFSIENPYKEEKKTIWHDGETYQIDAGHRVIKFKNSRHTLSGGKFICYHYEDGSFKEIDIQHDYTQSYRD
jgi:replicative DNA helicase